VRILFILVILAVVVAAFSGIDQVSETGPAISAEDVDGLRSCGPMRKEDPREDCVRRLQKILRLRGAAIPETGHYLSLTTEAVQQFQEGRGLPQQDGTVDEATLDALTEMPSGGGEWDLRHECASLRRSNGEQDSSGAASEGRCVVALRKRLNANGASLSDNSQFDDPTDVAVRAFQISVGLDAMGIVGPGTKKALYESRPPTGELTVAPDCKLGGCTVYLTRRMTKALARASRNDPAQYAITSALTVLACRRVKALVPDIVCQTVATYLVNAVIDVTDVVDKAQQASKRNACLMVVLGYPEGTKSLSPVRLSSSGGPRCND
jgi:peptidoglycan hydrolase-like protein with peptidoglycan-binding domain